MMRQTVPQFPAPVNKCALHEDMMLDLPGASPHLFPHGTF